ncbi:hypothetical protein AgCh_020512 [Apium graveolens]
MMRVTAKIGGYKLMVLIDSGSTHNFISDKVDGQLQLPVILTKPFIFIMTNGDRLPCLEKFEDVNETNEDPKASDKENQQSLHEDMEPLLRQFDDIFQEPIQLPPAREIDHCTNLKEGTEPVNIIPYSWDAEADASFNVLKQAMTSTPIFAMSNLNEPIVIESDASGEGIGAVITQQG